MPALTSPAPTRNCLALAALMLCLCAACALAGPPAITPAPDDSPSSGTETVSEAEALEAARLLFPEFKTVLVTNAKRADAIFSEFQSMPESLQRKLLTYLDAEWLRRKRELSLSESGSSLDQKTLKRRRDQAKELRRKLGSIRSMQAENEMKAAIKKEGWPALRDLEKLFKRTDDRSISGNTFDERKRATALRVGGYRKNLRDKLGEPATIAPEEELAKSAEPTNESRSGRLRLSASDRKILSDTESILESLPAKEASGIRELNWWRIYLGMRPLKVDVKLCEAARDHSKDMAKLRFFAHDSPVAGKKMPWDRAKRFGTTANSENIAIDRSPSSANKRWFFSPGHHKNMLNPKLSVMGLGINGRYYTQMFR